MSAILWCGISSVVYGTSIPTLTNSGWNQISIRASEVVQRSHRPQTDPRAELMKERVWQELKQLAPPRRLILTLFCIDGMKHQDIARLFVRTDSI